MKPTTWVCVLWSLGSLWRAASRFNGKVELHFGAPYFDTHTHTHHTHTPHASTFHPHCHPPEKWFLLREHGPSQDPSGSVAWRGEPRSFAGVLCVSLWFPLTPARKVGTPKSDHMQRHAHTHNKKEEVFFFFLNMICWCTCKRTPN